MQQVTFQVVLPKNRKVAGKIAAAFDEKVFNGCENPETPAVLNGVKGPKISVKKMGNLIFLSTFLPEATKEWHAKKFFIKHLEGSGIPLELKHLVAYSPQ